MTSVFLPDDSPHLPKLCLSIGMYDGVHLGHVEIIKKMAAIAAEHHLHTGILTFSPHPKIYFSGQSERSLLTTASEKTPLLENLGVDFLITQDFNPEFQNLDAETYVSEILSKKLQAAHILIGHDHTFGKGKKGDFALLEKMGQHLHFHVDQTPAVTYKGLPISSSRIRKALLNHEISDANAMLGRPYQINGKVIHGKKLGRTIGYPTANLEIPTEKLLPGKGAYIVEVLLHKRKYKGMLSIGTNPTVQGTRLSVEVYLLDFSKDIYGEELCVSFLDYLHPEIKFPNLETLIQRLDEDKRLTEQFPFGF